jgi:hypothetical protein
MCLNHTDSCTDVFDSSLQVTMDDGSPSKEKIASDPQFETSPNEKKIIDDQQSEKIIRV